MAVRTRKLKEVKLEELSVISKKNSALHPEDGIDNPRETLFGIALSDGGIRSATICLGFLKILNECGILSRSDYLSNRREGAWRNAGPHIRSRTYLLSGDGVLDQLRKNL